jgi:ribosomal protein S18 acetylase RimI-like enzyme
MKGTVMPHLTNVQSGPLLDVIRQLFLEYARGLDFNLCFQNFDKELAGLPGPYAMPRGRLVLCEVDDKAAGCIALKPLESGVCEMKRLFLRPEFRGKGLGPLLTQHIIDEARVIGYSAMRLDTIRGTMDNAIALYASLGFKEIPPYYSNPIANAFYMELKLLG